MPRHDLFPTDAKAAAKAEEAPASDPTFNLTAIGLPVVIDDRVVNYVFVRLRLHLTEAIDPGVLREKDPHIRDSLVRMGHRRPFTLDGEANRLNAGAMAGHVMATAARVLGRGVVSRVEVIGQQPRRNVAAP